MQLARSLKNEALKIARSRLWLLLTLGFTILPLVCGLFMIIMKDPDAARDMGLISMKAQLVAGSADWYTMLSMLNMGMSVAGLILFSIMATWVFGREFHERTVKNLLAIPLDRSWTVLAKYLLVIAWGLLIAIYVFALGILVGILVDIPGFSAELIWTSFGKLVLIAFLLALLMSWVAFFASYGRGYMAPMGWAFFTLAIAQILAVMGWGEWVPWSVPAMLSEVAGPNPDPLGWGSYLSVFLSSLLGYLATLAWWYKADQAV